MGVGIYIPSVDGADELPHPPIPLGVLLVVEQALRKAWELMLAKPRINFDLATAVEDEVTFEVHRRLKDEVLKHRLVPGFDREVLGDVVREPKLDSYNQASIDKMPDLVVLFAWSVRPTVLLPRQDAIFIECKPVDSTHPAGAAYCDKGVIRFVRGEYAWAMTSALMVGYSRPGYTIDPKLTEALKARPIVIPTKSPPAPCAQSRACAAAEAVHITEHTRAFTYAENGKAAPPIVLRHLWLRRA